MANPKGGPTNTLFKPGCSGNPGGKHKMPDDIKKALKLTNEEFIRIASKFLFMNRDQMQEALQNKNASMLELIVGGIADRAAKDNDYQRAAFLLDRVIGKPKEDITFRDDTEFMRAHMEVIDLLPREKLINLIQIKTENAG